MTRWAFKPCDPPDMAQLRITAVTPKSPERQNFVVVTAVARTGGPTLTYRHYDSGEWTQWQEVE